MAEQLEIGGTPGPEPVREKPALVTSFPGPKHKQYHAETMLAYLTNIERLALHVQTIEDWKLSSVDLLDNCRAAIHLTKCM